MVIGNWLFSPSNGDQKFFLININSIGLEKGIVGALKRDSMILISFSWLGTIKNLNDIYDALKIIKPFNRTLIIFLKWLQNIKSDFTYYYYSLIIRTGQTRKKKLFNRIIMMRYLILGSFYRFFDNVGKMTYAGESHNKNINKIEIKSIKIKDVSIKYKLDGDYVLKDISLNIDRGDVIYLYGKDKCGKSTLLELLAAYIPKIEGYIFNGSVQYNDIDIDEIDLKTLTSGIRLFNNYSDQFFLGLTVGQELLLLNENKEVCLKHLELVDLNDFWERDISTLSGGEKIRLLFAAILAADPNVILFDGPLAQLDPPSRALFISLLKMMKNEGKTIVIADYYLNYYIEYIDKILQFGNGTIEKIIFPGEFNLINIDENIERYDSSFTIEKPFYKRVLVDINGADLIINKKIILQNISFNIKEKEFIAIVGPNGGGKTSLLFLISKIYSPMKKSTIRYHNCNVGMVFQNARNQIIGETISEELLVGPSLNKWKSEEKEKFIKDSQKWFDYNLDKSTLDLHPLDIKKLTISGMSFGNNLILLDEPTLDIDGNSKKLILNFIYKTF